MRSIGLYITTVSIMFHSFSLDFSDAATATPAPAVELPSSLTLKYLLDLDATNEDTSSLPTNTKDLVNYLKANGVVLDDSNEQQQQQQQQDNDTNVKVPLERSVLLAAAKRLEHPSFWPKHASLHPNGNRVKNWLWVHGRYRNLARSILTIKNDAPKQKATFLKLHKKIESHSNFENTQLFKFFVDSKIGNQERFQSLYDQHKELALVEKILESFEQGAESGGSDEAICEAAKPYLQEYVKELLEHLKYEEETIVKAWLQLSSEEYKKYRTYLSWTYCVMY